MGAGGLLLILILAVLPAATIEGPAFCLFRRATGIACPACGLTRAVAALARGDWKTALGLHPLAPLLAAEALAAWAYWGLVTSGRRAPPRSRGLVLLAVGNAALLVALWLTRLAAGTLPR